MQKEEDSVSHPAANDSDPCTLFPVYILIMPDLRHQSLKKASSDFQSHQVRYQDSVLLNVKSFTDSPDCYTDYEKSPNLCTWVYLTTKRDKPMTKCLFSLENDYIPYVRANLPWVFLRSVCLLESDELVHFKPILDHFGPTKTDHSHH